MVESVGMQQVLQLSSTVEKVQMAQQNSAPDAARAFSKEMEEQASIKQEQTQEVSNTENPGIRDNEKKRDRRFSRPREREKKEDEEQREIAEQQAAVEGIGGQINLRA